MAKKMISDRFLRQRIALLREQGVDVALQGSGTVVDVVDIVGDLSLVEIHRLVEIATIDHDNAIFAGIGSPHDFIIGR
jgi:hypothetical protein